MNPFRLVARLSPRRMTLHSVPFSQLEVVPGNYVVLHRYNSLTLSCSDSEPEREQQRRVKKERARKKRAERDALRPNSQTAPHNIPLMIPSRSDSDRPPIINRTGKDIQSIFSSTTHDPHVSSRHSQRNPKGQPLLSLRFLPHPVLNRTKRITIPLPYLVGYPVKRP